MARPSNHVHVEQTLRALSVLKSEPGWHRLDQLAAFVGARPARLSDDLRRCCYTADDWYLPLFFGSDLDPPHPDGDAVVQLAADVPVSLPLPSSRVDLIRIALLADSAARYEPDNPRSAVLRSLHQRLAPIIGTATVDDTAEDPPAADPLRSAIRNRRNLTFTYRSLTDRTPRPRTVTPVRVQRQGRWWMLHAFHVSADQDSASPVSYRLDRIVGTVQDAGPAPLLQPPEEHDPTPTASVRLRVHSNDLWATDNLNPHDLHATAGETVEVTITLFPPVAERLSRLLFLTDPRTTEVLSGQTFLDAHRRHVEDAVRKG